MPSQVQSLGLFLDFYLVRVAEKRQIGRVAQSAVLASRCLQILARASPSDTLTVVIGAATGMLQRLFTTWSAIFGSIHLTYRRITTYNTIMKNSASTPPELQAAIAATLQKIGEQIVAARRAKRLTQTDLAGMLGVDQNSVSKYEKGDVDLSIGRLMHLGSVLGVDWIDLINPPKFKMVGFPGKLDGEAFVKNVPRPDEDYDGYIRRMVEGLISEKLQESESRLLERLAADRLEQDKAKLEIRNGDPAVRISNSSSTT